MLMVHSFKRRNHFSRFVIVNIRCEVIGLFFLSLVFALLRSLIHSSTPEQARALSLSLSPNQASSIPIKMICTHSTILCAPYETLF